MTEGDGSGAIPMAHVDASNVFNPTKLCQKCHTKNDIGVSICSKCGINLYTIVGADLIDDDDISPKSKSKSKSLNPPNQNSDHGKKKSLSNLFSNNKKIAAANPSVVDKVVVPIQSEGMIEPDNIEDFLREEEERAAEGRKNRNNNNRAIGIGAGVDDGAGGGAGGGIGLGSMGNRPLFTTIFVIYWLYYLIWFICALLLSIFSWFNINLTIIIICICLPSIIILILISSISRLNSINILNINYINNLNENKKQKYKLISILITILLIFSILLRIIWWIYCIKEYVLDISSRLVVTLICLLINECGIIILLNCDFIKISYFENNKIKQGLFGIIYNPYPCLLSLSLLIIIQFIVLTIASFAYPPDSSNCDNLISDIFECGLNGIYLSSLIVTTIIPVSYLLKKIISENHPNDFAKFNKFEQYIIVGICFVLCLLSFLLTLSIFAGFSDSYTWIHLLLLPQLFGIIWALIKLRKLSL